MQIWKIQIWGNLNLEIFKFGKMQTFKNAIWKNENLEK